MEIKYLLRFEIQLVPITYASSHPCCTFCFFCLTTTIAVIRYKYTIENQDFVEATEEDGGMFVVRSLRHGRRKALRPGQELMVNYNIPHYSPLDWFVSMGFIAPERQQPWQKVDAALPQIRRDNYLNHNLNTHKRGSKRQDSGNNNKGDSTNAPVANTQQQPAVVPSADLWNKDYGPHILKEYRAMQQQRNEQQEDHYGQDGPQQQPSSEHQNAPSSQTGDHSEL